MPKQRKAAVPERSETEAAVERYLTFLTDPTALLDSTAIATLERAASAAEDPLARLRATGALVAAQHVDAPAIEAAFVRHAKALADSEDIPASAFERCGVPTSVLRAAGILPGADRPLKGSGPDRRRQPAVPVDVIKAWIPGGTFTARDLQAATGGAQATVRKAISELVEAGALEELGVDSRHHGRGRAPATYRRRSQ